jgi:hypothetical protein
LDGNLKIRKSKTRCQINSRSVRAVRIVSVFKDYPKKKTMSCYDVCAPDGRITIKTKTDERQKKATVSDTLNTLYAQRHSQLQGDDDGITVQLTCHFNVL